jgi:hypothetical protein
MTLPPLVRRKSVWLPTFAGWLAIWAAAVASGAVLSACIYPFLATNNPIGAPVLVVEGWMAPSQLDHAAEAYRNGSYRRLFVAGGPLVLWPGDPPYASTAERAARYLAARGVPSSALVVVPTGELLRHRTYHSARAVHARIDAEGASVSAIDVVSAGPHARRSRFLYALAFGSGTRVGILAASPAEYEPHAWWRSSAGIQDVAGQFFALVWAGLFFWPEGRLL